MKQIGLALQNYQTAHGFFPPGGLDPGDADYTNACEQLGLNFNENFQSWVPFVLPYLEQSAVAEMYNLQISWEKQGNLNATILPVLLCPSVPAGNDRYNSFSIRGSSVLAASTDYAPDNAYSELLASAGLADTLEGGDKAYDGVMNVNFLCRIADITDGTSNTVMISEDAGRPDAWRSGPKLLTVDGQLDGGWADRNNEYITHGFLWDGSMNPGPCHTNCTNEDEVFSFHPNGAFHVFADGSVHFISPQMDIRYFVRLLTRAAGDQAPNDF